MQNNTLKEEPENDGYRTITVKMKSMQSVKEGRNAQPESTQLSLQLLVGDVRVRHRGQRLEESVIQHAGVFSSDRVMRDLRQC